jgi:membrane fusion protein (multidrug efflux system)
MLNHFVRNIQKHLHAQDIRLKSPLSFIVLGLAVIFMLIILFNIIKGFMIKRFFANFVPPAVTITAVTAKQQTWTPTISAVGNFAALHGVEVTAETSGKVVGIHFNSGEYVEEGTPLLDIDDSPDLATLKANQADLALQELNYQRQTSLIKRGATSSSGVDEARAKLLQAKANVEKTEATIRQKHIQAPFKGRLGIRHVNLGQFITPGQTAIVSLQSMDPLYLEFYVPEQYYKHLHINQPVTFSVDHYPQVLFEGRISALNSKVDSNTHNIEVQATLPNCPMSALKDPLHSKLIKVTKQQEGGKMIVGCDSMTNNTHHITSFTFVPGMFTAIKINEALIPNVLVIPTSAISYSLYGNSVFVIEKDPNNKKTLKVKRRFVSTGESQGNYTIIKKGLGKNEQIASSGELKLQDGTHVVIDNSTKMPDSDNLEKLGE